uniref:hypothetical protein n=1 Tax=Flavobacterium sp. TaxID=239 RepID=UPI00404A11C2
MKKKIIILILLFNLSLIYSQRNNSDNEIKILKELAEQMEKNRLSEQEAQKTTLNYYLNTKIELRKYYEELDLNEREMLDKSQILLWNRVKEVINMYKDFKGYKGFLKEQYSMLVYYNESIYELLYFLIDYDTSIEENKNKFDLLKTEKYWNFQMETPK